MKLTKTAFAVVLIFASVLIMQSCTTETKANETERTNSNEKTNKGEWIDVNTMESSASLKWHNIEAIEKLQAKKPKKVIVDVYTDWCRWCKVMDQKTFTDPDLVEHLNKNYYMVKFNGEQKTDVTFKDKKYSYISKGRSGYNTLAAELLKGRLSYPSFVVLDERLTPLNIIQGYKNATQFKKAIASKNPI